MINITEPFQPADFNFPKKHCGKQNRAFQTKQLSVEFKATQAKSLDFWLIYSSSLRELSAAILGHIFNNLPSKVNVKNPDKKPLFEESKCCLIRCQAVLVIRSTSDFFCRILNFFPFELLTKRHKNGEFQSKISPKVHHLRYPNYSPLKEQCLTCKTLQ